MLAKVATVLQSKVALAALGVLVVGGGGTAVAVAASQGHMNALGMNFAANKGNDSGKGADTANGHEVSAEGMLTACGTSTISVTTKSNKVVTFAVDSSTRFNGDIHANTAGETHSSAAGDNSANAGDHSNNAGGASSSAGDNSAKAGGASTTTFGLSDLCALFNQANAKVYVEVQGTPGATSTDNAVAKKVTVEGPATNRTGDSTSGDHTGSSTSGDHTGDSTSGDHTGGSSSDHTGSSTSGDHSSATPEATETH